VIIKNKGMTNSFDKSAKTGSKPSIYAQKKIQTAGIPTHAAVTGTQSIVNSSTQNLHAGSVKGPHHVRTKTDTSYLMNLQQ